MATTSADVTPSSSEGPEISWPLERPSENSSADTRLESELHRRAVEGDTFEPTIPYRELLPGKKRSQSSISLQSFILGQTFAASALLTYYFLFETFSRLWRPPFFLALLSLFHFLEYWTHARYNVPNATVDSFLLFNNGLAYQLAHGSAMLETIVTSVFFPEWQARFSPFWLQGIALVLIVVGQLVRSLAMATAGTNFNHMVQHKRVMGHELVTTGIYGVLRHPSYFGFWWWAVGTQMVLGNVICFWVYVLVLWRFFSRRIVGEERHLIEFFGDEYVQYRERTRVGIPFIP